MVKPFSAGPGIYTDDELVFRDRVRAAFEAEVVPAMVEGAVPPDEQRHVLGRLAQHGLLGTAFPAEVGGSGEDMLRNTLLAEELSSIDASLAAMRSVSAVFSAMPIYKRGSAEQRQRLIPPLLDGRRLGALAITEPEAGSDAGGLQTVATRAGDVYRLRGRKFLISNAVECDQMVVYARTAAAGERRRMLSAFVVEKSSPGLTVERSFETMGLRGFSHAYVDFAHVEVPLANRIAGEGDGIDVMTDGLVPERIDIASRALGCARACFEEAVAFTAGRRAFGRNLRQFQGVSFQVADMRVMLDAARLLVVRAARLFDQGHPALKESAIAKLFAAEQSFRVCDMAMQLLGGRGYTNQTVVERMFRDARVFRFGGGTDEVMRLVIQREEYAALDGPAPALPGDAVTVADGYGAGGGGIQPRP